MLSSGHVSLSYAESVPRPASQGISSTKPGPEQRFAAESAQSSIAERGTPGNISNEAAVHKKDQKLWGWVNRTLPMANVCAADAAEAVSRGRGEEETERRVRGHMSEGLGGAASRARDADFEKNKGPTVKQEGNSRETSSPHRRRRLSVSQSAEAKEDDGKERGQTIIAIDSEDAGHIFAQRSENAAENGTRKDSERRIQEGPAVKAGEERKRQEQEEAAEEQGKRETADDQTILEPNHERRDTLLGEEKTSLENLQRRRLSLSQSAEVVSPSESETRGHTSVQLDKEENLDAGRVSKTGAETKKDRSASPKHVSARVKSRGREQPSGRRLSVAGLSSEGHPQTNFEVIANRIADLLDFHHMPGS